MSLIINKSKLAWSNVFSYSGLTLIFAVASILITYQRLYFGVDFTDEAFYVAVPYRFVLGDRPFIDELNLLQTSSFLIFPFIKLYTWLVGGTDGIILFMRHIYLLFTFLIAGSIFLALKKNLGWQASLLISLSSIVFIPFNIPNLSYNTLGSGFFTIGCFLGLWVVLNNKNPYYLLLSGISNGLAVLSYPTMLIPAIFFILIFLFLMPSDEKLQGFLGFSLGTLLVALFIIPILTHAGLANLQASLEYINSLGYQNGGTAKLINVLSDFWNSYPHKILLGFVLSFIYIAFKIKPVFSSCALLLVPLVISDISGFNGDYTASMKYISYYSLLAPYFLLFIGNRKFVNQLFAGVWMPSFVAGMTTAWSSSNGYINAAIGLFPASLVTSIFLIVLILEISSKGGTNDSKYNILYVSLLILFISIFLVFQYSSVYRDDKIAELHAKVESGPYSGLYTTEEKKKYIDDLTSDIKSVVRPHDRILVFDNFPAGYLLSSIRPATNTLWLNPTSWYPNVNRQATIDYFQKNNIEPDIAVKIKKLFTRKNEIYNLVYPESDPINNMIKCPEYREFLSQESYTIYLRAETHIYPTPTPC